MRRIIKYLLYVMAGLIAFVALYILAAFLLSRWQVNRAFELVNQEEIPFNIYILTNGVHTDIVVPVQNDYRDWSKDIPCENTVAKDTTAKWLALGWGDRAFYLETPTWADLKFSTALNAAFGLSSSAIHATYYHQM